MMGVRDLNVFPLYGQRKNTGDVGAPFFPGNGIAMYVAAIGADGGDYTVAIAGTKGYGVTGTASGVGTGAIATGNAITQAAVLLNTNGTTTVSVASGTLSGSAVPVYNFPGAATVTAAGSTTFTGSTVTGTTLTTTATDTGQAIAGINTVVLTGTATGIVAGTYVQIDVNGSTTTAEVRKVTNVTTATTTTLTLDYPLFFTHAVGAAVIGVTGPFTHTVIPTNVLPSLTIEKNIGGYQSIQFTGSRVDKYGLKIETSDAPVSFSAGVTSQSFQILGGVNAATLSGAVSNSAKTQVTYATAAPHGYSVGQQVSVSGVTGTGGAGTFNVIEVVLAVPTTSTFVLANTVTATYSTGGAVASTLTPITVANELPFVFSEAVVNMNFGAGYGGNVQASQVANLSLDVENGIKPTYTFNGSHDLQFLTPVSRKISGQMDVVFTSLTDSQWGFFDIMQGQIQGSVALSITHPTGSTTTSPYVQGYTTATTNAGYGLNITLPAVNFAKYTDALKMEDVVMTTLNFEASYPLGTSNPQTIQSTIVDGQYLPF